MGVELREARRGDEPAVADIHVRAWQEAYRGLIPDEFLDALEPEDRARTYTFEAEDPDAPTTVVAVQSGEDCGEIVLGFVTFCRSRDADAPDHGEVVALYVDPDRYEGGVGRMLMAEARRRLWEAGFVDALLWVLDGTSAPRGSTKAKAGRRTAPAARSIPTAWSATSAASAARSERPRR